jgi:hypothetical protein
MFLARPVVYPFPGTPGHRSRPSGAQSADADLQVELVALGVDEQDPSGKEHTSVFADTI